MTFKNCMMCLKRNSTNWWILQLKCCSIDPSVSSKFKYESLIIFAHLCSEWYPMIY